MNIGMLASMFICTVMFSRLAVLLGAPTIVNFFHFSLLFVLPLFLRANISSKYITKYIGTLLFVLGLIFVSAFLNGAAVVNVILEFLLVYEPYILFLLLIGKSWSKRSIETYKVVLIFIVLIHTLLAYLQKYVLGFDADDVEGLMINMGAGSHLAGAISLTFSVYYLVHKKINLENINYYNILLSAGSAYVVIISDAKQVVAVFLTTVLLMVLINLNNFRKMIVYFTLSILTSVVIFILMRTVFPELGVWARIDLIQDGILQKIKVFEIINAHYEGAFHFLYGLGPGHTAGRLAVMIPTYEGILGQFGATTSQITYEIWQVQQGHHLSNSTTGSSMFSLFFSWAGIFGDLGIFGIIGYLLIWYRTWSLFNGDELSRFLLVSILVFGGVYGWLEEPQYMLFAISILALRYQQRRLGETSAEKQRSEYRKLNQYDFSY